MQEAQAVLDYCVKIHNCTNVQWAAIYFHLEEENNCGRLPTRIQCSAPNTCHKFLFIAWTKTAIVSVYYACTRHFKERYRLEWTRKARMYCVTGETQSLYHRYLHRKVTTSRMLHFCCCTALFFFFASFLTRSSDLFRQVLKANAVCTVCLNVAFTVLWLWSTHSLLMIFSLTT